jgi:tetratricopeptide (TPR) repeat protein
MRLWMLLVAWTLWPAAVWADDLQRARELFDEMEYQQAHAAAGLALQQPEAGPAELAEAYRLQGLSLSALEQADEALAAFRCMLSIDPAAQLPPDTSPKLAAPFYQAVAMAREIQPIGLSLAQNGPRATPGGKLQVLLKSDPLGMVRGVRLVSRQSAGAWTRGPAIDLATAGQAALELPNPGAGGVPGSASAVVEYYLEALTAAGGVLARLGGVEQPFRLDAAPRVADEAVPVVDVDSRDDETVEEASPWYETWWFWTAVGAVVVGTAVGLGVGLGAGGSDEAVGYHIRFP